MICSNCERLELFVGGEHFATIEPDREGFGHVRHPPSFADLTVEARPSPTCASTATSAASA
jgi:beta-galactosidase